MCGTKSQRPNLKESALKLCFTLLMPNVSEKFLVNPYNIRVYECQ
jgi:hypothetical protein